MRRLGVLVVALGFLVSACGNERVTGGFPAAGGPGVTAPTVLSDSGALILARGTWRIPAADYFHEPGFHFVVEAVHDVPSSIVLEAGWTLVVSIRDAARRQPCGVDHPLSGCVTVDWSDDPSRPQVPESGVFEQTITLGSGANRETFALRKGGSLASEAEAPDPGGSYTAIGNASSAWSVPLPRPFTGGGTFRVRMVLTKFLGETAEVTYEVRLEPPR